MAGDGGGAAGGSVGGAWAGGCVGHGGGARTGGLARGGRYERACASAAAVGADRPWVGSGADAERRRR